MEVLRLYLRSLRLWKRITNQRYIKAMKVTEISELYFSRHWARNSAGTLHLVCYHANGTGAHMVGIDISP